jgi:hypothetical protein
VDSVRVIAAFEQLRSHPAFPVSGDIKTRHRWRGGKAPSQVLSFLSIFFRLLLLALLLCGQFLFAPLSF